MECQQCKRPFQDEDRIASISGSVMGNEDTDVYYLCPACDQYSVATWCDHFGGEETVSVSGPLSREKGDAQVELIRKCARPWDKKCRCDAHLAYFKNGLD